jgi:hypothetical protein
MRKPCGPSRKPCAQAHVSQRRRKGLRMPCRCESAPAKG